MKSHKTPLRYPGGKSRACIKMDPYIPDLRDYNAVSYTHLTLPTKA